VMSQYDSAKSTELSCQFDRVVISNVSAFINTVTYLLSFCRFSVDQVCCLDSKDHGRFNATIVSISPDDVSASFH